MSTFLYARPSDRKTGTLTVNTGTEDAAYPKANLVDNHPEKPAKFTTTTGSWVDNLGSAQRIDFVDVIHHNFAAGLEVRIQAHTSDSWGAPSLNQLFTVPARYADQFPVNIWLNLKALIPVDASRTFQFWRLAIIGVNTAAISVGEWHLWQTRRDLGVRNIKWGSERRWRRPAVLHETDLLVRHTYDYGTTVRAVEVDIDPTDTTLVEVETWYRDAQGIAKPFVIIPHQDEADAWMVTFTNPDQPFKRVTRNVTTLTLPFQEMSRGLFP